MGVPRVDKGQIEGSGFVVGDAATSADVTDGGNTRLG